MTEHEITILNETKSGEIKINSHQNEIKLEETKINSHQNEIKLEETKINSHQNETKEDKINAGKLFITSFFEFSISVIVTGMYSHELYPYQLKIYMMISIIGYLCKPFFVIILNKFPTKKQIYR